MNPMAKLWPELFGPQPEPEPVAPPVKLPPEPMYRDPTGGDWKPLPAPRREEQ